MNVPRLSEFGKGPVSGNRLSFKAGSPAAAKRSTIAEGVAKSNPGLPMANKFAIATAQTKKVFRKKKGK